MSKTAILILAAGESKRLGSPKQLLPYKESNLLLHTIEQFHNMKDIHVFVVLGAYFGDIFPEIRNKSVTVIKNNAWMNGMGSSVSKGVELIRKKNLFDRVLITLCDLPLIETSHYQELIDLSISSSKRIVQTSYEDTSGVPVIFDKSLFNELSYLSNDLGAKPLIKKYKKEVLKLSSKTPYFDIDTDESYQKLLELS